MGAEVPPPPLEATHGPDQPATLASPRRTLWLGLGVFLLFGVGLVYWLKVSKTDAPRPDATVATAAIEKQPESVGPSPPSPLVSTATSASSGLSRAEPADAVAGLSSTATSRGQLAAASEIASTSPPAEPNEQASLLVRNLSVSSAVPGPRGRATIDGKVRHIGDRVAPGLRLHEVNEADVIFIDDAGATYPRRF